MTDEDALVLFEFLARNEDADNETPISHPQVEDPAELLSLWQLHGALQRTLVAPYDPDYRSKVETARATVRAHWGLDPSAKDKDLCE